MKFIQVLLTSCVLVGLFQSCQQVQKNAVSEYNINSGWQYRKVGDEAWSGANVPGGVHTDLLADSKIEDPFFRLNEKDQQWIGESDWEYRTTFQVTEEQLEEDNAQLIFQGLDTYADVYLNGNKLLQADNMFRTWEVDAKSLLVNGENELRVYFHNVFKVNRPKYDSAEFRLQAFSNNDQADVKLNLYSRKAGFHYGWDWGPRLITSGIWRPVLLRTWSDFKIDHVYFRQPKVTSKQAQIIAEVEVSSSKNTSAQVSISHEGQTLISQDIELKAGKSKVAVPFSIDNPALWWTNGLGDQPLYTFKTKIQTQNGAIATASERIGIRSLEIIREPDSFGKSLYVKLNGVPVFMKGANYIPQDNFQNRVTQERYEHIIQSAKDANMNMLRVWGGGIYEEDTFYDLCDENGLLVWQDIMFACGMYPGDRDFLQNVKYEVIDNLKRLRNHASVALYCGNNENEISWYSWGWKEIYNEDIQKKYENDLKQLFYQTIPEAIAEADPDRYYHPSSPIAGIGEERPKENGDTHYWGVWHGKEPFKNFDKNVSRFVSEYGFQSYPEFSSIKKFSIEEDWFLESEVMQSHQRCMADDRKDLGYGNRLINTYLERNFKTPKDFENYIYVVQALQAKGVKTAVESHRRNRTDNYCMGTMYWQINDCWPVASWSSIDYYGKWKALHYIVKQAYAQVVSTHTESNDSLNIFIISDELQPITNAEVIVQVMDFGGKEVFRNSKTITIEPNTSNKYLSFDLAELLKKEDRTSVYLKTVIKAGDSVLHENRYFFDTEKHLSLPKANVSYSGKKMAEGYEVTFQSDTFAKYVMIASEVDDLVVSDNYFDLDANIPKVITLKTKSNTPLNELIQVRSLTDSYKSSALYSMN